MTPISFGSTCVKRNVSPTLYSLCCLKCTHSTSSSDNLPKHTSVCGGGGGGLTREAAEEKKMDSELLNTSSQNIFVVK